MPSATFLKALPAMIKAKLTGYLILAEGIALHLILVLKRTKAMKSRLLEHLILCKKIGLLQWLETRKWSF